MEWKPSPFPYLKKEAQQLGKAQRLGKGKTTGAKNSLPSPIQCGWDTMGRALTDGTHPARWNGAWLDGTWPGYGPPLPYDGHKKQSATMLRRPSAFLGYT